MALCACGHHYEFHVHWTGWEHYNAECSICGCPEYQPRHDPRYDPDDVADQGYGDEGHSYSGMGKVRR